LKLYNYGGVYLTSQINKIVENSGDFVDKDEFFVTNLARIMFLVKPQVDALVQRHLQASATLKGDGSPVTALDLALSDLLEQICHQHYPASIFYSEEKFSDWALPMLVVDPLDGTKEFLAGRPEWALSVAHLETAQFQGEGWIYNPMTQEIYAGTEQPFRLKSVWSGEVSRSEWNAGLFSIARSSEFIVKPMGSIAYKLGRLSQGQTDFVVSLRPKNIWDIAAGTILCQKAGMKFYAQGKEVTTVQPLYHPPLIWCHEEIFPKLSELFP
jgi:myo-inositol-1(or 4)-monophosphatase